LYYLFAIEAAVPGAVLARLLLDDLGHVLVLMPLPPAAPASILDQVPRQADLELPARASRGPTFSVVVPISVAVPAAVSVGTSTASVLGRVARVTTSAS
jgi:hypothetical protein